MNDVQLKPQVYRDPRPKEFFDQFHARVRAGEPEAKVYEVIHLATLVYAILVFRARAYGTENVPNGPLILAPNHGSFMDHFFTAAFIRRRVQFMGKSQLFSGVGAWIFSHGGVFPVRRGQHDEESFISAFRVLERGGPVVMYCEGGRSRTGKLAERAKPGIGRLALESGVPVVPLAILGSHRVRNWKRLQFPRITILFGPPFKLPLVPETTREQQQQAADFIFSRIKTLHGQLAEVGHRGAPELARQLRAKTHHVA